QLEQQAATGHILEPADAVAPVPSRTQLPGEPRPIGVRMGLQPVSNQHDILGADRPPLNDQFSVHGLGNTEKEKMSPEKNNIFFIFFHIPMDGGRKTTRILRKRRRTMSK